MFLHQECYLYLRLGKPSIAEALSFPQIQDYITLRRVLLFSVTEVILDM